jgi:hypothetical protein
MGVLVIHCPEVCETRYPRGRKGHEGSELGGWFLGRPASMRGVGCGLAGKSLPKMDQAPSTVRLTRLSQLRTLDREAVWTALKQ